MSEGRAGYAARAAGAADPQMDVNLDAGVTADNFEDTLDIWRQLVDIYEREILVKK